jgi:2-polyprenyl-3-methyl-5-hydroxy-6-metoxy-1,4-benzoquinol methylase
LWSWPHRDPACRDVPNSRFTGVDLSREAIEYARNEVSGRGLNNIDFKAADASDFDNAAKPESFDFITTFDAIHDQARPLNVLKGIYQALKPDGVYLMRDISGTSHILKDIKHPIETFFVHYLVHALHDRVSGARRGKPGCDVGRGENPRVSSACRFSLYCHPSSGT